MHARIGRLNTLRPVIVSPRVQRVPVTSVFQGARLPSRALATPTALPAGDAVEQHQQPGQQRKQPGHEQQQPGHHQKQPQLLLQQGRPQIGPTLRRRSATSLNHHDFSTPLLRSQQLSRHFASSSISGSIPSQSTCKSFLRLLLAPAPVTVLNPAFALVGLRRRRSSAWAYNRTASEQELTTYIHS